MTPPIISSHDQLRSSPRLKPRERVGSSATIDRPRRLARPPLRLGGSTTPTPTSRSWAAAVRTSTKASAGVSCMVSGAAASRPRSIGSNTCRARPRPSSNSRPGWLTLTSPIWRVVSPALQTAPAGSRRLGSASAWREKRSSQSSSSGGGANSSRQARAGATRPATASRQWWVAISKRSIDSLSRAMRPSPEPRDRCQADSSGSRPVVGGLKPARSWPASRASSRLATRSRPLPGRRQATAFSPGDPGPMAQVATWGSRIAISSSRWRSPSRLSRGHQRAWPSSTRGSQRPRAIKLRAQRCRWLHQRSSSARSAWWPERGRRLSHSPAAPASRAQPSTCQGHHWGSLGIGSPACRGSPLQGASASLRLPRTAWPRLGRESTASAGRRSSVQRSWSSSQPPIASRSRASGCSGTSRPGCTGEATRQVSAQSSRRPPAPSGG